MRYFITLMLSSISLLAQPETFRDLPFIDQGNPFTTNTGYYILTTNSPLDISCTVTGRFINSYYYTNINTGITHLLISNYGCPGNLNPNATGCWAGLGGGTLVPGGFYTDYPVLSCGCNPTNTVFGFPYGDSYTLTTNGVNTIGISPNYPNTLTTNNYYFPITNNNLCITNVTIKSSFVLTLSNTTSYTINTTGYVIVNGVTNVVNGILVGGTSPALQIHTNNTSLSFSLNLGQTNLVVDYMNVMVSTGTVSITHLDTYFTNLFNN